jgi:hypothetical protein
MKLKLHSQIEMEVNDGGSANVTIDTMPPTTLTWSATDLATFLRSCRDAAERIQNNSKLYPKVFPTGY